MKYPRLDGRRRYASAWVRRDVATCAETILTAAVVSGCATVVLGAIGCGADRHPPEEVAAAFRQALLEGAWLATGAPREVLFCVLEDHNAYRDHNPEGNLAAFVDALHWDEPAGLESFRSGAAEAPTAAE
eukprot:7708781-Alexandrium_andersonii.AAC.1